MPTPIHRRPCDAFLSHAHQDRATVESLYRWLTELAGFSVWYDARRLDAGAAIGRGLQEGIAQSRGVLLVASPEAVARGWVQDEIEIARDEHNTCPEFRVVALRVRDADVSSLWRGISWIDAGDGSLTPGLAAALLRAFHPGEHRLDPRRSHDVYISASWHADDRTSGQAVCRALAGGGFRLVGDAKDQRGFGAERLESLLSSCGACVCVIPFRGEAAARADTGPYRYFLRELDRARGLGLPTLVVADPRVVRADGDDSSWLRMETTAAACPPEIRTAIDRLWEDWEQPRRPHEVFLAIDLDDPFARWESDLRDIVERVTGMPTVVGNEIRESTLQVAILQRLSAAFLVLADISGDSDRSFNLNACVEAGMARAAGTNLELIARGLPRSPPFMLRDMQLPTYADDVERLGLLRRIVWPYRRRIINAEL